MILVGIDVSDRGWDSEMIEYAFIFSHKNVDFMIYNETVTAKLV